MARLQLLETPFEIDAQSALRLPLGAASPLWAAYAGATAAGLTWWWMTRWMSPTNLEALGALPARGAEAAEAAADTTLAAAGEVAVAAEAAAEAVAETVTEAALEIVEAVAEAAPEPVAEAIAETVAAVTPEPVAEAPVEAPKLADDLTRIVGIGPKLAASLAERGVTTFAQIAGWQAAELDAFDKAMDLKGRAVRDAWVAQARRFAEAEAPLA